MFSVGYKDEKVDPASTSKKKTFHTETQKHKTDTLLPRQFRVFQGSTPLCELTFQKLMIPSCSTEDSEVHRHVIQRNF
jgi:uncharacterized protein YdaT